MDNAHIRKLDGTLLLVFRELLHERRATAAAVNLGLTQSGVSHALNRLRELFGDTLFLRRPHGLEPTQRAIELAPHIEKLLGATREILAGRSKFAPGGSQRQFRIGAPDFMTVLLASTLVRRVKHEAPAASVSFTLALGSAALDAVRRGEIDLALGRLRKPGATLHHSRLFRDSYAVVGRARHPALQRKLSAKIYTGLSHVLIAAPARDAEPVRERAVFAVVPHFMAAFAIVAESDAIVIAPRPLAARYAKAFGLTVVPSPAVLPPLDIAMVRREGPDAAVTWLAECVRESVGAVTG